MWKNKNEFNEKMTVIIDITVIDITVIEITVDKFERYFSNMYSA